MSEQKQPEGATVSLAYELQHIETIRRVACGSTYTYMHVIIDGRDAYIPRQKYGSEWWRKATEADIRRVAVY